MAQRPPVLRIATAGLNEPVASSGSSNVLDSRFERASASDKPTVLPRSLSLNSKTRRRDTVTDQDRLHPWTAALKRSASSSNREQANSSTTSLASTATSASEYATDSAYGTLDEYDDSPGEEADDAEASDGPQWAARSAPGWRDRVERSFRYRAQRRVQAVLDEEEWSRRVERAERSGRWHSGDSDTGAGEGTVSASVGNSVQAPQHRVRGPSGFQSAALYSCSDSLASSPTNPSSPSLRSSPEPSEYGDADAAAAAAAAIRLEIFSRCQRLPSSGDRDLAGQSAILSRRHTLPRRRASHSRSSPSKPACEALASRATSSRARTQGERRAKPQNDSVSALPRLQQLTLTATLATLAVSTISTLSSVYRVVPVSPVHLRNPPFAAALAVELGNAALAPFLAVPSLPSAVLTFANLCILARIERDGGAQSIKRSAAVGGAFWCATLLLRATVSHVLGRIVGWAHPELLSTSAVHEVGHGLTPLLLALVTMSAVRDRCLPDYTTLSILAAGMVLPNAAGGSGRWLALCAATVGAVAGVLHLAFAAVAGQRASTTRQKRPVASKSANIFALLLLPIVAHFFASTPRSNVSLDQSFSLLHPTDPTLLTVLLMTAPRPGNPDFLVQTVESWLDAFPAPSAEEIRAYGGNWTDDSRTLASTPTSSRIKMVVYTHFAEHDVFDAARSRFDADPKARHYIEWHRDPRAFRARNRLDQRLHVARGLAYAAAHETAYVLLTEDDFPLCGDSDGHGRTKTWQQLQQALVRTNELMPDAELDGNRSPGHCGLFFATGGSGFAIRRPIAARLPGLLLGDDDVDGALREAAAERGEVVLKREGEDADTPDLVIQDCLRGKLPECADLCGPNVAFAPQGSARRAGGLLGDRYGKSGLTGTERLLQRHLGYNASTLPGRSYGREEWACGWRQPFNGEPDVLTV